MNFLTANCGMMLLSNAATNFCMTQSEMKWQESTLCCTGKKKPCRFFNSRGSNCPGCWYLTMASLKLYIHDVTISKEAFGLSQEHLSTTGPNQKRKNLFLSSILNSISVVKYKSERNRTYSAMRIVISMTIIQSCLKIWLAAMWMVTILYLSVLAWSIERQEMLRFIWL